MHDPFKIKCNHFGLPFTFYIPISSGYYVQYFMTKYQHNFNKFVDARINLPFLVNICVYFSEIWSKDLKLRQPKFSEYRISVP